MTPDCHVDGLVKRQIVHNLLIDRAYVSSDEPEEISGKSRTAENFSRALESRETDKQREKRERKALIKVSSDLKAVLEKKLEEGMWTEAEIRGYIVEQRFAGGSTAGEDAHAIFREARIGLPSRRILLGIPIPWSDEGWHLKRASYKKDRGGKYLPTFKVALGYNR